MDLSLYYLMLYIFSSLYIFCVFFCLILYVSSNPYPMIRRSQREKCFKTSKEGEEKLFPSIKESASLNLTVIVPAYNEELRLPPMLDECISFLESRKKDNSKFSYEIIIVSDGSRDNTVDVGLDYTEKYGSDVVRVLALQPNRGKGGAIQLGVQNSRGSLILFADADGATHFPDLVKLEQRLKKLVEVDYIEDLKACSYKEAIVCGSRAHLEEDAIASRSFFRTLLMHCFHFLVWALAVRTVRDTQCGFKLFTRQSARSVFSNLHVQRWAFDVELLHIAEAVNIPIAEVAVNWTEIEGSKIIPVLSWLQMGKDLILIWLRYTIGAWKIKRKDQ